ncbi:MAG: acetyl-CoA carboxylase biotin carboxyl carrier protein [Candidatus Kryptoniota bacterium]
MDLSYLRKLVKLVDESGVDELEIEEEGTKVRISKSKSNSIVQMPSGTIPQYILQQPTTYPSTVPITTPSQPSPVAQKDSLSETTEKKYHEVRSPIVGTFYRAPAPNADPYVEIGSNVQVGTVLCIIEAMKLMNEIESDVAGRVVKICVENGQPVEYNQCLFMIDPS